MNIKLNNDMKSDTESQITPESHVKEERRRTGRYIAILVGISLFILALYHAWVRRIPVIASLVVPALIMFVYVAWVLYTASRDKNKCLLFEFEAGSGSSADPEDDIIQIEEVPQKNVEITVESESEPNSHSPIEHNWAKISPASYKDKKNIRTENKFVLPMILVNDKPPDNDLDQKWLKIINLTNDEKLKCFFARRRFKRRFCRSRRNAVLKRSYSIA